MATTEDHVPGSTPGLSNTALSDDSASRGNTQTNLRFNRLKELFHERRELLRKIKNIESSILGTAGWARQLPQATFENSFTQQTAATQEQAIELTLAAVVLLVE